MQAELPPGSRQTIQQQGGLSSDTRAMMLFEANKKTALVAYILWFFTQPGIRNASTRTQTTVINIPTIVSVRMS